MRLNLLVKSHIKHKSKKEKLIYPNDIDEWISSIVKDVGCDNCNILFCWLFDSGSKILNACSLIRGVIIVNAEWAAHLALFRTDEVKNAFCATIGHELTHQDNDYVFWEYFTKDKKFVNWVNEVHADFGGAVKNLYSNRSDLIKALEYKRRCKGSKDRSSSEHPSWEKRLYYVKQFDFDEKLIKMIASDVGCTNEKLIVNVCSHFEKWRLV